MSQSNFKKWLYQEDDDKKGGASDGFKEWLYQQDHEDANREKIEAQERQRQLKESQRRQEAAQTYNQLFKPLDIEKIGTTKPAKALTNPNDVTVEMAEEYARNQEARAERWEALKAGVKTVGKYILTPTTAGMTDTPKFKEYQEEQDREHRESLEKRQRDAVGAVIAPYRDLVRYDELEKLPDYASMVEAGERAEAERKEEERIRSPLDFIEKLAKSTVLGPFEEGKTSAPADLVTELTRRDGQITGRQESLLNDTEKDRYYYLLAKAGQEAADTYLNSLKDQLALRGAMEDYEAVQKFPGPIRGIEKGAVSFSSGVQGAVTGFKNLPALVTGGETDYSNTELEYLQSLIHSESSGIPNLLYQSSYAIGNMAPSIALGLATGGAGAGGSLGNWLASGGIQSTAFSAQTAGQTYRQDLMEGRPVSGAQLNAMLTAADEAATNWLLNGVSQFGGGVLKKALGNTKVASAARQGISHALAKNPGARSAALALADWGGDAASEASQEALQNITESMRKALIYGDEFNLADELTNPETWEAALVGGVTAGIMNAPGAIGRWRAGADMAEAMPPSNAEAGQEAAKKYAEEHLGAAQAAGEPLPADRAEEPGLQAASARQRQAQDMEAEKIPQEGIEAASGPQDDPQAESAVKAWGSVFESNGQKAFEKNYDGQTDIGTYYKAFSQAYNVGRYETELTQAQRAQALTFLSSEAYQAAQKAGYQDANMAVEARKAANTVSEGIAGLGMAAENATAAQKTIASHVGKLTGLTIDLVDSLENPGAAASYEHGRITIDINASDFNGAISHELTHYIQDQAPEGYRVFQKYAVQAMTEAKSMDLEAMLEATIGQYEQAGQTINRAQAMDELTADATQKFLNDPKFIESVIKEDRTLGQKILDFLTDIVEALKELAKAGSDRAPAKAIEEKTEYYERLRDNWYGLLEEASDNYKKKREKGKAEAKESTAARYQLKQGNKDSQGRELSPEQQEYFKDSKVRDENGNLLVVYHGTPQGGFTEFKPATYFTPHDWYAERYAEMPGQIYRRQPPENAHKMIYESYLNIKKPFDTRNPKERAIFEEEFMGTYSNTPLQESGLPDWTDGVELMDFIEENELDYDGLILDEGGDGGYDQEVVKRGLSYVIMSPEQVKNADNRKPTDHKDIRFQLEDVDSIDPRELEILRFENQTLKEANELLEKQFKLTSKDEMRQEDISKIAREFLKQYNSDYKRETLERNLSRLYEYIRSSEQPDGKEVTALSTSIAKSILKNAKSDSEFARQYSDLRRQIRNTKLMISEQDRADLAAAGGYNAFRKKYFGKLKLGKDGITVDSFYEELAAQYPELFDIEITHPADRLMTIAATMDQLTEQVKNPYHADMDEMAYILGQDILMAYFDVGAPPPTFADKKAAEVQRVRRAYSQKLSAYKNQLKQKYEEAVTAVKKENLEKIQDIASQYRNLTDAAQREYKEYYRKKMDDLRSDKNQAMAAMQKKHREQMEQRRDTLRARKAKEGIMKHTREMGRWLTEPTDKKHVPESLRTPLAEFLNSLDFSSNWTDAEGNPAQRTVIWQELSNKLNAIVQAGDIVEEEMDRRIVNIDPSLPDKIQELAAKVKGLDRLEDLSANDLERVYEVVISMRRAIEQANKLISNANYEGVQQAAEGLIKDISNKKTKTEFVQNSMMEKVDNLVKNDMLDSLTAFGRMGPVMKSLYQELRNGEDKHTRNMAQAVRKFQETCRKLNISKKELREWDGRGKKAKRETFVIDGKPIELTYTQIMSLYELNKRGQAQRHLYKENGGGGIVPADFIEQSGGKGKKLLQSVLGVAKRGVAPTQVTKEDIRRITSVLDERQRKFADALQGFMEHEAGGKWGNEASMIMYGYKKYNVLNYFRIKSYDNAIPRSASDVGMNALASIKNMGATKATSKTARNALVLESIIDVYLKSTNDMSLYNALLIPLTDFQKVYNYKSETGNVREEIERVWGRGAGRYFDQVIRDINGRASNPDAGLNGIFLRRMKAAAVAGNLRVAIQQPTALIRAMVDLSPVDVAKGVKGSPTLSGKKLWETMCRYAPITQWKDWGFYKMDLSKSMKDILVGQNGLDAVVDKTSFLASEGDKMAWKALWSACEYETLRKHPKLEKGSEQYYQKVGARFSEIIDETQVVNTVLHKTQIARQSDGLVKMSVSFMDEPLKGYNMLYRAAIEAHNSGDIKTGSKIMGRAAGVWALSQVVTAAAAAVLDMLRDDEEESKKERYLNALVANSISNLNPVGMFPVAKDIMSILQGYTVERSDLGAFSDIARVMGMWQRYFDKDTGSQYTPFYLVEQTVSSLSALTGVPAGNIIRDMKALTKLVYEPQGSDAYEKRQWKYDLGSKRNLGMYTSMMVEAVLDGDEARADEIYKDLIEAGGEDEKISERYDTEYKNYLMENVPQVKEAAQYKADGDFKTYGALYDELLDAGYEAKPLKSAISTLEGEIFEECGEENPRDILEDSTEEAEEEDEEPEEQVSAYESRDLIWSIEQLRKDETGAKEQYNAIVDEIYQTKIANGMEPEKARGSLRSTITRAYKPKWQAAGEAEKDEILILVKNLQVDGRNIYSGYDFNNWRKKEE